MYVDGLKGCPQHLFLELDLQTAEHFLSLVFLAA